MDRENIGGRPHRKQGSESAPKGYAHSCFVLFGGRVGAENRKEEMDGIW